MSNKSVFMLFSLLTLIIYYATKDAGLIFDFNAWALVYEKGSYADVLNSFGYNGLHQVEQFVQFTCYKLFGFNGLAWYLIYSLGHAFAATLGFAFIKKWLSKFSLSGNEVKLIAICTSALFLLSPFAADTLVNKVSLHYITSLILLLSGLLLFIRYYDERNIGDLLLFLVSFLVALFTLEISYIFPIIYSVVWGSMAWVDNKWSLKCVLPALMPFAILIVFLALHRVIIGNTVGHYGSEVHLQFHIPTLFSNVSRYFASYLVLFDYWPYQYKEFASEFTLKFAYLLIAVLTVAWLGTFILAWKRGWRKLQLILFVFLIAVLALGPVANLYYTFLLPIKNDRYAYIASLFIYLFLVLLFSLVDKQKVTAGLTTVFILIGGFFLTQNIITFKDSALLSWGLLDDYKWFEQKAILLNTPDNYSGTVLFGTKSDTTSFSESLLLHSNKDERNNIISAMEMNFIHLNDSVIVTRLNSDEYRVEIAQWGNWYWNDMIGATSYENENFSVTINKEPFQKPSYNLKLKEPMENAVLLYIANGTWQQVK